MSGNNAPARLALEDGSIFPGNAFGAVDSSIDAAGEVVFNTAHCGYQEALTDPSYAGQILTFTAPMIGNYGIAAGEDDESARPQVAGVIIRELSRMHSNYRATHDLASWLAEHGVMGIHSIDTRALVTRIREAGALRGVISCRFDASDSELVERAQALPVMTGQDLATPASCREASQWTKPLHDMQILRPAADAGKARFNVAALDCGGKWNIYRNLTANGCVVHVLPCETSAQEILAMQVDGVFISNGPGDPSAVQQTIQTLRDLTGRIPMFGICLGAQLLALAMGGSTYKLKFGHRGVNQPVRNTDTGRVEITSQNHGFAIDEQSLAAFDCVITHVHLNDQTVAGFRHRSQPILGVQFHPEASPGPHDSAYLFDCFAMMMQSRQALTAENMAEAHERWLAPA